jgi:CFEM-containing surface protein
LDCVTSPQSTFGCDINDNACLCKSQQYVQATTQCIVNACNAADAATAEAFSRGICADVVSWVALNTESMN